MDYYLVHYLKESILDTLRYDEYKSGSIAKNITGTVKYKLEAAVDQWCLDLGSNPIIINMATRLRC